MIAAGLLKITDVYMFSRKPDEKVAKWLSNQGPGKHILLFVMLWMKPQFCKLGIKLEPRTWWYSLFSK